MFFAVLVSVSSKAYHAFASAAHRLHWLFPRFRMPVYRLPAPTPRPKAAFRPHINASGNPCRIFGAETGIFDGHGDGQHQCDSTVGTALLIEAPQTPPLSNGFPLIFHSYDSSSQVSDGVAQVSNIWPTTSKQPAVDDAIDAMTLLALPFLIICITTVSLYTPRDETQRSPSRTQSHTATRNLVGSQPGVPYNMVTIDGSIDTASDSFVWYHWRNIPHAERGDCCDVATLVQDDQFGCAVWQDDSRSSATSAEVPSNATLGLFSTRGNQRSPSIPERLSVSVVGISPAQCGAVGGNPFDDPVGAWDRPMSNNLTINHSFLQRKRIRCRTWRTQHSSAQRGY